MVSKRSQNCIENLPDEMSVEVTEAMKQIKSGEFVMTDMSDKKKVKKYLGVWN